MENLMGSAEFLTVVAVSGGVAYIAVQAHERLLSDFMDKIHSQFEGRQHRRSSDGAKKVKKKVHIARDMAEPSSDNKDYRRRKRVATWKSSEQGLTADGDQMPMNRQVFHRGIIKQKTLLPQAG